MTVSVIGLGYIGLPTALLLAKTGISVYGCDVDTRKIRTLSHGSLPFTERGLDTLFSVVQTKKTFKPSTKIHSADAYLIAVPTPQRAGKADLTYVLKALESVQTVFKDNQLIIIESTVGPRDCIDVIIPQLQKWGKEFSFVHCPERAIPGNTLKEMVHNDRIIGCEDDNSYRTAETLYRRFVKGGLYKTTTTIAASAKVMENTYRATNIALANEFAQLAEELQFDVWEAIELANKHPRVSIHQPGPGVGGHCIPIDPWFFSSTKHAPFITHALEVNEDMPVKVASIVTQLIKAHKLIKPTIGILGYAYKKNVDDSRETPVQKIVELLQKKYVVHIHDPHIPSISTARLEKILATSQVIVLATDHDEYRKISFSQYPTAIVYDTRNIFTAKNLRNSQAKLYTLGAV